MTHRGYGPGTSPTQTVGLKCLGCLRLHTTTTNSRSARRDHGRTSVRQLVAVLPPTRPTSSPHPTRMREPKARLSPAIPPRHAPTSRPRQEVRRAPQPSLVGSRLDSGVMCSHSRLTDGAPAFGSGPELPGEERPDGQTEASPDTSRCRRPYPPANAMASLRIVGSSTAYVCPTGPRSKKRVSMPSFESRLASSTSEAYAT